MVDNENDAVEEHHSNEEVLMVLDLQEEDVDAHPHLNPEETPPRPARPNRGPRKSNTQIAGEVWLGRWGDGDDRKRHLEAAGYDPEVIQNLVNKGVGKNVLPDIASSNRKPVAEVIDEVIEGLWGEGDDLRRHLARAGYNATTIQNLVAKKLG